MYKQMFQLESDVISAIASPRRLEIVHLLREGELCVRDIEKMLDLPQANISQHLTVLRQAGVVKTHREGKKIFYKLAHDNFIKISDLIRDLLIDRYKNTDLCDEFCLKMKDLVPITHDPVCKMRVSPKTASYAHKHKDEDYYFCASGCLRKFKLNPEEYIKSKEE
jgi:DNA-binding transcriptional ArsR family regulator/YHS domain-containing protein